jgi:phospholipid transport system substrate-binding protein
MTLRAFARTLVLALALTASAALTARAADDASGFIADLGKRAIDVLTAQSSDGDRERQFLALFEEGFDVPAISRFVLGPYWRSASDPQRDEFQKLFKAYIVHAYVVRFNQYSGQQMKIAGQRQEGDTATLVMSQIQSGQGNNAQPIKVDWRVAKADHGFKITVG